jgi:hypothetical protein
VIAVVVIATRPGVRDALADVLVRFTRSVVFAPRDPFALELPTELRPDIYIETNDVLRFIWFRVWLVVTFVLSLSLSLSASQRTANELSEWHAMMRRLFNRAVVKQPKKRDFSLQVRCESSSLFSLSLRFFVLC